MNKIKFYTAEKELYYQEAVIVKYAIEYPQIVESVYKEGKDAFNYENRKKALELKEYAENEIYEQAKQTYKYHKKLSYPVTIFELMLETKITYQDDNKISLYQDKYIFKGKAYRNTIREKQIWELSEGKMLERENYLSNGTIA